MSPEKIIKIIWVWRPRQKTIINIIKNKNHMFNMFQCIVQNIGKKNTCPPNTRKFYITISLYYKRATHEINHTVSTAKVIFY